MTIIYAYGYQTRWAPAKVIHTVQPDTISGRFNHHGITHCGVLTDSAGTGDVAARLHPEKVCKRCQRANR